MNNPSLFPTNLHSKRASVGKNPPTEHKYNPVEYPLKRTPEQKVDPHSNPDLPALAAADGSGF